MDEYIKRKEGTGQGQRAKIGGSRTPRPGLCPLHNTNEVTLTSLSRHLAGDPCRMDILDVSGFTCKLSSLARPCVCVLWGGTLRTCGRL